MACGSNIPFNVQFLIFISTCSISLSGFRSHLICSSFEFDPTFKFVFGSVHLAVLLFHFSFQVLFINFVVIVLSKTFLMQSFMALRR